MIIPCDAKTLFSSPFVENASGGTTGLIEAALGRPGLPQGVIPEAAQGGAVEPG